MRLIRGIRVFIFKMIISEIRGDPLRKYFAIWGGGGIKTSGLLWPDVIHSGEWPRMAQHRGQSLSGNL